MSRSYRVQSALLSRLRRSIYRCETGLFLWHRRVETSGFNTEREAFPLMTFTTFSASTGK